MPLDSTDLGLSLKLEYVSAWHLMCFCVGVSGEEGDERAVFFLRIKCMGLLSFFRTFKVCMSVLIALLLQYIYTIESSLLEELDALYF